MKAFIATALIFTSISAQAEVVSFTVPAPETNEGLYLCNAGVSHLRADSSTATPCVEGGECSAEAVTDPARGNDGITYQSLQGDGMLRKFAISAPKNGNYSLISPMNSGWDNKITELNISLSSEVYGAKYFLEFCYQGPVEQMSQGNNGNGNGNGNGHKVDLSEGIYQLQSSLFANTVSYISTVGLATRISWSCDLRAAGLATKARTSSELTPLAYEVDSTQSVIASLTNISASALSFTHTLNSISNRVPRFCVVRLEFAEDSAAVRSSLAQATEFTVDLNFFKSNF
jgi:hypothetical protein